jgi:hypothetical protein
MESPTQLRLAHQTFANDIVVRIFVLFAGRDNHDGQRGFHPVRGLAGRDGGRGSP